MNSKFSLNNNSNAFYHQSPIDAATHQMDMSLDDSIMEPGGPGEEMFPNLIHLEDEDYSMEGYYLNGMDTVVDYNSHHTDIYHPGVDEEQEEDDSVYYERISVSELTDQCIMPTLSQALQTVYPLLICCLLSRSMIICCHKVIKDPVRGRLVAGVLMAALGLTSLYMFYQENMIFVVMLVVLVYPLLSLTHCKCHGWTGISVSIVSLVYLLTCELVVVKHSDWHQIRGAQMILVMKMISLAFDLDTAVVRELPSFLEYCGYVLHSGSVMFGPWTSYQDYNSVVQQPDDRILDFYWVMKVSTSFVLSFVCVLMSTCFYHWVLLDTSFMWLIAYRDAASFRFSHYFVCYLSELTQTLSGLGGTRTNSGETRWDLTTTKVFHIEFPRSLVEVVTGWNLPMHYWLKTYVFKNAKPLGNFSAILLTYAASSVLHGVNFQLSSVLLSLGFYTYIEYVLRRRLGESFSACIEARRCKPECSHTYKSTHPYVLITNIGFGFLSVFHLAYLGLMFDSSAAEEEGYSMDHTLSKWSSLGYTSHWIALATYIFYVLI